MSQRVSASRQEPSVYDIAVETDSVPELEAWISNDLIAKNALRHNNTLKLSQSQLYDLSDKADAAYDTFVKASNFNQTKGRYKVILPPAVRQRILESLPPSTREYVTKSTKRKKPSLKKRLGNLRKSLTRRLRPRRSTLSQRGV